MILMVLNVLYSVPYSKITFICCIINQILIEFDISIVCFKGTIWKRNNDLY